MIISVEGNKTTDGQEVTLKYNDAFVTRSLLSGLQQSPYRVMTVAPIEKLEAVKGYEDGLCTITIGTQVYVVLKGMTVAKAISERVISWYTIDVWETAKPFDCEVCPNPAYLSRKGL